MGEIADMMLEGLLDEETGEYIGDDEGNGFGYPTSARKQLEIRNNIDALSKAKKPCDICGRKVKSSGLWQHKRDVHGGGA